MDYCPIALAGHKEKCEKICPNFQKLPKNSSKYGKVGDFSWKSKQSYQENQRNWAKI